MKLLLILVEAQDVHQVAVSPGRMAHRKKKCAGVSKNMEYNCIAWCSICAVEEKEERC